jgi:hypothetical protein
MSKKVTAQMNLIDMAEEALRPLELYQAYGWADRDRVIPRLKRAIEAAKLEDLPTLTSIHDGRAE